MAAGILLIIIGAIFALAIRAESSWLDVHVFGLILMLGGAAFIWRARLRRRVVVRRETEHDGERGEAGETTIVEQRVE